MRERTYLACDLKSFYASVECIERGLDPLTTNLMVADLSRTEKTICLAVTPSLKAWGISGRARLFEVVQRVKEVNAQRQLSAPGRKLTGSSSSDLELKANPSLAVDYIVAPPRMAHYMEWSTRVYNVYLKYIAPEDIDHSWGWEPVALSDIKAYKPESKSIGSGQVLQCPYQSLVLWKDSQESSASSRTDSVPRRRLVKAMTLPRMPSADRTDRLSGWIRK